MSTLLASWRRLPVLVRAVVMGVLLATAGTLPWAYLVSLNIKHASAVPWAVPPAALYLWFFWRYARGWGWPRATAEYRKGLARANRLDGEVWGMALLAGIVGLVALLMVQAVLARMVTLPQQHDIDPSKHPALTVFLWVAMGSLVAGVVEETSFRGYMQGPIERRHGPVIAILVTAGMFGLAHFTHPEWSLVLLPFYIGAATVYGMLAYLTKSILPGLVLHAGGDVLAALQLFATGQSEWQGSPGQKLIWETGADPAFWLSVVGALAVSAAAVWAYVGLARVARAPSNEVPT